MVGMITMEDVPEEVAGEIDVGYDFDETLPGAGDLRPEPGGRSHAGASPASSGVTVFAIRLAK